MKREHVNRSLKEEKSPDRQKKSPSRRIFYLVADQPRSQALSPLPPFVVGRKTLVAAGHVTTCDTNFFTRVESTNIFVDIN